MPATIRRADTSDADLGAVAAVVNEAIPEWPTDVDSMRREDALYPGIVRFIVEQDGRAVGVGIVGRIYIHPPEYDALWATVAVTPESRRRGIGGRLLSETAEVARAAGKSALHAPVSEERPDALSFLVHRGFREHARHKMVRLELEGRHPPADVPPPGIALTTLAERPELIEGVHAVAVEAFADIPGGDEPPAAGDLAEFRARDVDWPTVPHDAFMIAEIDEADAALVTGHVGPAGEGDSLANQGLVDQAAEVGTHGGKLRWRTPAPDGGRKASYSAAEAPAGANPGSHAGLIAPVPIVGHLPPYGMPP